MKRKNRIHKTIYIPFVALKYVRGEPSLLRFGDKHRFKNKFNRCLSPLIIGFQKRVFDKNKDETSLPPTRASRQNRINRLNKRINVYTYARINFLLFSNVSYYNYVNFNLYNNTRGKYINAK